MFGCVVSGRIVQTNAQQVDTNRFVFTLDKANQVQHIAIFLLGTVPLPEGYGASVFFGWPPYQDWKYLGYITNQKASAIFRFQNKGKAGGGIDVDMGGQADDVIAQLGISIEPLQLIEQRHQELTHALVPVSSTSSSSSSLQDMQTFTQKMCENLCDYVMSFTGNQMPNMIPANVVSKWYENFQRKIKMDPFFWKQ